MPDLFYVVECFIIKIHRNLIIWDVSLRETKSAVMLWLIKQKYTVRYSARLVCLHFCNAFVEWNIMTCLFCIQGAWKLCLFFEYMTYRRKQSSVFWMNIRTQIFICLHHKFAQGFFSFSIKFLINKYLVWKIANYLNW